MSRRKADGRIICASASGAVRSFAAAAGINCALITIRAPWRIQQNGRRAVTVRRRFPPFYSRTLEQFYHQNIWLCGIDHPFTISNTFDELIGFLITCNRLGASNEILILMVEQLKDGPNLGILPGYHQTLIILDTPDSSLPNPPSDVLSGRLTCHVFLNSLTGSFYVELIANRTALP
ncbi:unnamed protein product [Cylicocyclus nassatus]|uniref:Uncharacterized protein n=1 Tax=Cylicocyclus nassatus TaxID=53992 RepID=A0AA36H993_CYLNA|nr:unnamed protein product [Cylicocyclus nassatus]